jgi:hypothetical protein
VDNEVVSMKKSKIEIAIVLPPEACGWWMEEHDEVLMRYYFNRSDDGSIKVRVFSFDDAEELEVRSLRLSGKWICFTTYCESTDYSARHRWCFESSGMARHQYTLEDRWVKATKKEVGAKLVKQLARKLE